MCPLTSWRGTACKGTGLSRGRGVWPSTSPPGGVWRRRTSRRDPSPKLVAAARPLTTTTASNPNVALWNKKTKTKHNYSQHNIPASKSPSSSLIFVFRAPFWISFCFDFFFLLSFLHKGKTNHIPVKGEIPAPPDVVFPAFPPSLQSLPSLTPFPPLFPLSSSLCGTEVFIKKKKGNECTLDSALNRLTHFIDDADDTHY